MAEAVKASGGSVDTSMYALTPTVKFDPAASMTSALTNANAMQQNKLLQGAVQIQQPAINNSQIDNAHQKMSFISSQISPLITLGDKVTADDLGRTVTQAVQNSGGAITPEEGSRFYQQIAANPAGIPAALQQFHTSVLGTLDQLQVYRGGQGSVDNGNSVQHTRTNMYTGAVNAAPGGASNIPRQLGPSDRVSPQSVYANGQQGSVPIGQRYDNFGNLLTGQPASAAPAGAVNPLTGLPAAPTMGAGAAANMAPRTLTQAPDPTGGRMRAYPITRSPAANDPGSVPATAPGQPATPPGFMPTAANPAAGGSIDLLNKDRAAASNYSADVTPLQTAIAGLDKLGPQGTGPATAKLNDLKSLAISLGVPGASGWTDNVKAYDETRKYLLQNAMKGGTGTNDQLAASIAGNPSVGISNAAASDIAKQALALRRMQHAGYLLNQTPGQEGSYADRTAQWNSKEDPRAYALDLMSPAAKASLFKSLGAEDSPAYKRFKSSLEHAHATVFGGGQ